MKYSVLGVLVDQVDYASAVAQIISAAHESRGYAVSALAVHGIMTGVLDRVHRTRLNSFDLVTPDGQPVRWAMRLLHGVRLLERVYGPTLTLHVLREAEAQRLPVYFYGSRPGVLGSLLGNVTRQFPELKIAGAEPSRFRAISQRDKSEIAERIRASGARILFVGLGCPRQEVFAYEIRDAVRMPVLAVGAAFDYHAGLVDEPPAWIQQAGLQWLYRLIQEPRRLWRRYILLNPAYLALLLLQLTRVWHPRVERSAYVAAPEFAG